MFTLPPSEETTESRSVDFLRKKMALPHPETDKKVQEATERTLGDQAQHEDLSGSSLTRHISKNTDQVMVQKTVEQVEHSLPETFKAEISKKTLPHEQLEAQMLERAEHETRAEIPQEVVLDFYDVLNAFGELPIEKESEVVSTSTASQTTLVEQDEESKEPSE
jgi:hypothetical protein